MGEELTAKEALEIIGEICGCHDTCAECPFGKFMHKRGRCHFSICKNVQESIKICKQWKAEHAPIETEWRYICRIIKDTGSRKECVYEEDITESENRLPFGNWDCAAENVLKEYCKNHKGRFFATIEHVCVVKGE